MCKLFGIVEIENQKNAELFAKRAIPLVTKTDNHGLGIMRLGEKGVHIQRWLEPPTVIRRKRSSQLLKYEKALKHQHNEEGTVSKNLYALAIHGRFATCTRSLENTHPFYRDGAALMHNGIIPNAEKFERVLSTCDSEALLSQYLKHKVIENGERLTSALEGVGGYYAAIVFNDSGVVDIWRDASASLFLAHVRGVGVVFATTAEIITGTARRCKAYITGIDEILPFTAIRWNKGLSPQISTFESVKPYSAPFVVKGGVAEGVLSDQEKLWHSEWEDDRAHDLRGRDYYEAQLTEDERADMESLKELQGIKRSAI